MQTTDHLPFLYAPGIIYNSIMQLHSPEKTLNQALNWVLNYICYLLVEEKSSSVEVVQTFIQNVKAHKPMNWKKFEDICKSLQYLS